MAELAGARPSNRSRARNRAGKVRGALVNNGALTGAGRVHREWLEASRDGEQWWRTTGAHRGGVLMREDNLGNFGELP